MTLESAVIDARALDDKRKEAGIQQESLDEAARVGFGNGSFEESEEELPAILEELFPEAGSDNETSGPVRIPSQLPKPGLKEKLNQQASLNGGA